MPYLQFLEPFHQFEAIINEPSVILMRKNEVDERKKVRIKLHNPSRKIKALQRIRMPTNKKKPKLTINIY